jgi:hypothetical protein
MNRNPASFVANTTTSEIIAARGLLQATLGILARDPSNTHAHPAHGSACLRRGLLEAAQRSVDTVLSLAPGPSQREPAARRSAASRWQRPCEAAKRQAAG